MSTRQLCAAVASFLMLCAGSVQASALSVDQSSDGSRTYRLPQRLSTAGVPDCRNAQVVRVAKSGDRAPIGEPGLIEHALRTGKPLKLREARCDASGAIEVKSVELEHEPSPVADVRSLPLTRGRHQDCK